MKKLTSGTAARMLILGIAFLGQAHLSYAALPAATFVETLYYPSVELTQNDAIPEVLSAIVLEDWRAVDGAASTRGGSEPAAFARMAMTVDVGLWLTFMAGASGSINYYWSVERVGGDPFTGLVPVNISVKGAAQFISATTNAYVDVYTRAYFDQMADVSGQARFFQIGLTDAPGTATFDETWSVMVAPDGEHRVQLQAVAGGAINMAGSFSAEAWVDPIIVIDSAFARAGDFRIVFSEGITAAIPEPETYAMLLAGLGLLGFMARRRKQSAA